MHFPWSGAGAEAVAGELDDGARAKRLCQSCGLPVSQVLMCTLSATLAEKIGQATASTSGTQISPPPAHPTAYPQPSHHHVFVSETRQEEREAIIPAPR